MAKPAAAAHRVATSGKLRYEGCVGLFIGLILLRWFSGPLAWDPVTDTDRPASGDRANTLRMANWMHGICETRISPFTDCGTLT